MELFASTGTANPAKQTVHRDMQGIRVRVTGGAISGDETVRIRKQSSNGEIIYCHDYKIVDLARLSDDGEGANYCMIDSVTPANNVYEFKIDICREGNVPTENDEVFEITLKNLETALTYTVYSIEVPTTGNGAILYRSHQVNNTLDRYAIDVRKYSACMLHIAGATEIELVWDNGKTTPLDVLELPMMANQVNDASFIIIDQNGSQVHEDAIFDRNTSVILNLAGIKNILYTGTMDEPSLFEEWIESTVVKS